LAQLILVSNRVSVPDEGGVRAGGLEVAVKAALKRKSGTWLGWSGRVTPRAKLETRSITRDKITYIVCDLAKEDYQEYYNGFANRVLWPILHYQVDRAEFSRRDLSGYLRVNDYFAQQLHSVLKPDDLVWVHDYHLMPLAKALRDLGPTQGEQVVLHQDFHGGNVLRAGREPWLAIDPKPLAGEREFDAASLLRDRREELDRDAAPGARVRRRLDQLTFELGLDRERLRGWAIAHALAWGVSGTGVHEGHVACARWLAEA